MQSEILSHSTFELEGTLTRTLKYPSFTWACHEHSPVLTRKSSKGLSSVIVCFTITISKLRNDDRR